jgi:hypothetical protein
VRNRIIDSSRSDLPESAWIRDISGALTAEGIGQFLNLVETLSEQHTLPDSED